MTELEAGIVLRQGLGLVALLEELSDRITKEVSKACEAIGLKPPRRVILSLTRFNECRAQEVCQSEVCGYYDCEREEVVLSLPCANGARGLLRSIAHELVHHCQHVGGDFCKVYYTCEEFRKVDTMLPYRQRPHEAEAYLREEEFIQKLGPHLEEALEELLQALKIALKIDNPPPVKTHLLYVEPGGRAELRGFGFIAELVGRAQINAPLLLYWPEGVFLKREVLIDLANGVKDGVYVFLGEDAKELYNTLSNLHKLEEKGELGDTITWLFGIRPEWIRRRGDGSIEISYPAGPPEDALSVVRVVISEKTWPYHKFEKDLRLALEFIELYTRSMQRNSSDELGIMWPEQAVS